MIAEKDIEVKTIVANNLWDYTTQLEYALKEKWRVSTTDYPWYSAGIFNCTLERDVKILPPIKGAK
jgi:hypothetical protein